MSSHHFQSSYPHASPRWSAVLLAMAKLVPWGPTTIKGIYKCHRQYIVQLYTNKKIERTAFDSMDAALAFLLKQPKWKNVKDAKAQLTKKTKKAQRILEVYHILGPETITSHNEHNHDTHDYIRIYIFLLRHSRYSWFLNSLSRHSWSLFLSQGPSVCKKPAGHAAEVPEYCAKTHWQCVENMLHLANC